MTLHPALPDTAGARLLQIVIRPKGRLSYDDLIGACLGQQLSA